MKRGTIQSLIVIVIAMHLTSCDEPTSYSAESITATIVDADTRKPLEGVIVVAHWQLVSGNAGGSFQVGQLMVQETVTDKEGHFHFPAWGPKRRTQGYLINWDPRLLIFKSGYEYKMLVNDFKGEGMWKAPVRKSKWNNQTLRLRSFKGNLEDYSKHLFNMHLSWAFTGRDCTWKDIPKMVLASDKQAKVFREQRVETNLYTISSLMPQDGYPDECRAKEYFLVR